MLRVKQVKFSYKREEVFSFDQVESQPEPTLILGASGCGKTTLLHLMAGLLKPQSGEIWWGEININTLTNQQLDRLRGKELSIVFQKPHFIQAWNVTENICSQAILNGKKITHQTLEELLVRLNINHLKDKKVYELSEGEKQRVSIARALIHQPKYILADEPSSALDDKNAFEVIELLTNEAKNLEAQIMIITHDQRLKDKFKNRIEL